MTWSTPRRSKSSAWKSRSTCEGSFLDPATAPIVAVSSKTGAGLDELRSASWRGWPRKSRAKDADAAFRLPIDRVFTMKGFGTVVTGTLISGSVRKDDELEVHPSGKRLRVRGVQVHDAAVEKAVAGQRTALNLAGVETSELARGMMLTPPGLFRPTRRVSVKLNLLPSAKPLRDGARVHLHAFTAETIAEVQLLGAKQLQPGQSGFARLKLDDASLLLPGRPLHRAAVLAGHHDRRRSCARCSEPRAAQARL